MRKFVVVMVLGLALLLMGLTLSASALTINDPSNGETHLYQIFQSVEFNAGTYANSQALADAFVSPVYKILETLPVSSYYYEITGFYATWAGWDQTAGYYTAGNVAGSKSTPAFITTVGNHNKYTAVSLLFNPTSTFGFYDTASGDGTKATELLQNPQYGLGIPSQSNGLIFDLGGDRYIVAFEDGGAGCQPLGDKDYNDLVFNVQLTDIPVPLPPTALLLGTGLLGLVGLRRWRKTV